MANNHFNAKKKYGQNFLTSKDIPRKIAAACGADKNCAVLEIGPGKGILTAELAKVSAKVCAIEIDRELKPFLEETLSEFDNTEVIYGDILDFDLNELITEHIGDMPVRVCANLPYYITTPILMKLFESRVPFLSITVMVQKEVANRLVAKPGSNDYGAITAMVNYYSDVRKLFVVPAGCFNPKPKVDSAVVRFDLPPKNPISPKDEDLLFGVVKAAFAKRRKTLVNNLYSFFCGKFSKTDIAKELKILGFDPSVRGERLSIGEFCIIADHFCGI